MKDIVEHDDSQQQVARQSLRSSTRVLEPEEAAVQEAAFEDSGLEGSPMGEHIMQRLRYFENLSAHQAAHIAVLSDMLTRHGAAAPAMPHFPELKSPVGNHDPN